MAHGPGHPEAGHGRHKTEHPDHHQDLPVPDLVAQVSQGNPGKTVYHSLGKENHPDLADDQVLVLCVERQEGYKHAEPEAPRQGKQPAPHKRPVFEEPDQHGRSLRPVLQRLPKRLLPGQKEHGKAEIDQDQDPGRQKDRQKTRCVGEEPTGRWAQAHATVQGRGVPPVGPPQVGHGRNVRHKGHHGGAEGGQADTEKNIAQGHQNKGVTHIKHERRTRQNEQAQAGEQFAAHAV